MASWQCFNRSRVCMVSRYSVQRRTFPRRRRRRRRRRGNVRRWTE